jgi:hypothetical protein
MCSHLYCGNVAGGEQQEGNDKKIMWPAIKYLQ